MNFFFRLNNFQETSLEKVAADQVCPAAILPVDSNRQRVLADRGGLLLLYHLSRIFYPTLPKKISPLSLPNGPNRPAFCPGPTIQLELDYFPRSLL